LDRRDFILFGGMLLAHASALAQPVRKVTVAILSTGRSDEDDSLGARFYAGLRQHGWVEGRNITYVRFFTEGSRERLDEMAKAAAARKPDLIFAPTAAAGRAARRATTDVPIVFIAASDPIYAGLVASLSHPRGNATGVYHMGADIVSKRLELVRELIPRATRVGVLLDRLAPDNVNHRREYEKSAPLSGFSVLFAEFGAFDEVDAAVAQLRKDGASVLTMNPSFTLAAHRRQFAGIALRERLPLFAYRGEWAEAGALLSYGAHIAEAHERSAQIAHRILTGARPADTPVEQASRFELVFNLRTARALGVKITPGFLARADRVIE
jgi:putative ABC transport system substrate-binding protein